MSRGTKGSHPPTLIRIVERTLSEEASLLPGQKLLLAVSGGSDSTALLHVMSRVSEARGFVLFAHGIDHGLRPEAREELDRAESLATTLGIPFSRSSVQLSGHANLQANARQLRYEALRVRARELDSKFIVTAHHATDRAETVLLRMLRGAGLLGLGVMPVLDGDLLRPFIRAQKSDVLLHLERHHLGYSQDPSNTNPKFTRVRVRTELIPLMESLDPSLVAHLCALADDALAQRSAPEDSEPWSRRDAGLGRKQRAALDAAILNEKVGFELPVSDRITLRLEPKKSV